MYRKIAFSKSLRTTVNRSCSVLQYSTDVKQVQVAQDKGEQHISVPYRIQRGPTDILKALSSTIKKDYLAPHYKYHDDPYFIPISNVSKRSYALSKESGRKAARYFLENYSSVFKVSKSEPRIKAFDPPVYREQNVTEDTLKSCVASADVSKSLRIYNELKEKDVSLTQETKQCLLELLCFYNGEQPPRQEYTEERWYASKPRPQNIWKNNGEADKLFQEMDKDAAAYCAMIQGTAKFLHAERAVALYEEMCAQNFKATTETYNSLLRIVPFVKNDGDMRWQYAMDLCENMKSEDLQPNLGTMNALLSIASKSKRWNKARPITMQILAEMEKLNIEPSMGSYFHVLVVFLLHSHSFDNVFPQILSKIENRDFQIRHPDDVNFFGTAMEICSSKLMNKDWGYRLHNVLERGDNYSLLNSSLSESIYFRHFFLLMCHTEEFDKFMEVYEKYVPHVYSPEASVMLEMITAMEFSGNYTHLLQICSDVSLFEHTEREDVFGELLRVSAGARLEEKEREMLISMIWSVVEKLDERALVVTRRSIQWTGAMLGDILKIVLNGNDLEKAWSIMQRLKTKETSIVGYPNEDCIMQFCRAFLQAREFDKVEYCVKYALDSCCPDIKQKVYKIASELFEKGDLEEQHRDKINSLCEVKAHKDTKDKSSDQNIVKNM